MRARPNRKSTRLASHQAISASRAKPESPRSRMRTRGQRRADLRDDARDLLHRAGRGVDVRAPQLGRQQMAAAEHVERQVAVAVVIAVEEPAFLMAVQRIVRGIEIEDDLLRRLPMRVQEQIDEQRLDRRRIVADLGDSASAPAGSAPAGSASILPASGAQSDRCAASLPASTASTGSCRSSSWSFRSS